MPLPAGFIPDNAPEGFMPDEEQAQPTSKSDALKFGIGLSAGVPSMLSRVLQSGAIGSEMGRGQLESDRQKERQAISEAGIGAQPVQAQDILDVPGKVLGTITSTAGDLLSDWLRRSGLDPSAMPGRNIVDTGPLPITNIPGTRVSPLKLLAPEFTKGVETKAGEIASGFTEPGQAALLPVAPSSKVIQGLFAGQALAQLPDSVKAISEAKTPQELGSALTGAGTDIAMAYMLGRGLLPEKGKPDAIQERSATALPVEVPPGGGEALGQGIPESKAPPDAQGRETPVQAQTPDVSKPTPAEPVTAKPEVAKLESVKLGGRVNTFGDPIGTTYHATPEDWSAWQKVESELADATKAMMDAGRSGDMEKFAAADANRVEVQKRSEAIRNAYGGMNPEPPKAEPAQEQEKITAAAVKAEGQVHTGANHPEILQRLGIQGFDTPESRNTSDFGFVTDKGRFISREEAGPIAEASGQNLKTFEPGEPVHSNEVESPKEPGKPLSETGLQTQPEAVAKAQVKVAKVSASEGQRSAKDIKTELVSRLNKAIEDAPNEADVAHDKRTKVTIDIPDDGVFTVWNTKENLTGLLERAKKISTTSGPSKTKSSRFQNVRPTGNIPSDIWVDSSEPTHMVSTIKIGPKPEFELRKGKPVTIEGQDLYLTSDGKGFTVTDPETGYSVGNGDTIREATDNATDKLKDWTSEQLREAKDKALAKSGKAPQPVPIESPQRPLVTEPVSPPAPEAAGPTGGVAPTASPVPESEPPAHADSPDAEIGVGNETGAEMSLHGTTSGLPPSVPDRGKSFPAELLEASRQLGTLVRSRVTLPKGVQGQYVRSRAAIGQNDRIEVGDIRNQLTVAHEMGHDLDALIWPAVNLARSQRSLEARVPGTTGKQLQAELVPVSELMRGPITGTKGHQAYRKSAVELIADFFALYAHDPETARTMAPKFAKGFEAQLAKKPDAAGVIHQLLEGNVEPVPAEAPATGPAATPQQLPGKVLPRILGDTVKRDFQAAVAGQDLVKGLVREFESRVQRSRVVADSWRREVPSRAERADVGAFVEGIGNIEIPGDTIDSVKDRMTPQMRQLAKTYRFAIEAQRNDINAYLKGAEEGEYIKFLEDYLPHFYANSTAGPVRSALSKFVKDSPNAKARKLPTMREAIDIGLIPITQDPAVLYEHHANVNWRVATNRQLMASLKDLRLSTGEPAVVPAKDSPPGWVITQNPLVQRVYARQTPNGVMIWKGGAAIQPDVWNSVRQMLDTPVSSDFAKGFDALNGLTRANAFAFSLFHDITLRSAALGEMMGMNPFRGLFRLFERNPTTGQLEAFRSTRGLGKELLQDEEAVSDAAKHGLKFSWTESESYQRNARDFLEKAAARTRDVPVLGKSAALARDIQHMRQEGLWKNTHDAFKIVAYDDAVSKALANAPKGTNPQLVKEQIASRLNDAFGGQEWQTKFWLSPQMRLNMSRFLLAPDWTFSTLRSVPGASDLASLVRTQSPRLLGREAGVPQYEGPSANLGRARFWGGEIAALATATIAAQYAIYSAFGNPNKGDKPWVWENEIGQNRRIDITPLLRQMPWHDPKDPTRYYVNLGKRPEEILGWFIHPEQNIQSKMSRPVAEVFKQITGTEGDFKQPWKQDHETFAESIPKRAVSVGKELVPFVFAGNQFALSVPYRKGMTKSKAQNAYESVYELAAEPNLLKSLARGQLPPEGSLTKMVSDITDAAKRNGVPAEEIRKRSLSTVRGHHYSEYFKALKANDKPAMEKEAKAIIRLGGTQRGMQQSIENREKLSPRLTE